MKHFFIFLFLSTSLIAMENSVCLPESSIDDKTLVLKTFLNNLFASAFIVQEKLAQQPILMPAREVLQELGEAIRAAEDAPEKYTRYGYRDDLEERIISLKDSFKIVQCSAVSKGDTLSLFKSFDDIAMECWHLALQDRVESWLISPVHCFVTDSTAQ